MSVTANDLARLAALAALEIPDDQVPALVVQLDRIVSYVGQLAALAEGDDHLGAEPAGGCRFRTDEVRPTLGAGSPADFAPQFVDGFFVVPRSPGPGNG